MICPYCLCETEPYDRYHERDHPACLEVQRLRRQLELVPGGPAFDLGPLGRGFSHNLGRFFHEPEGNHDGR